MHAKNHIGPRAIPLLLALAATTFGCAHVIDKQTRDRERAAAIGQCLIALQDGSQTHQYQDAVCRMSAILLEQVDDT